jgi:hypothetical protein
MGTRDDELMNTYCIALQAHKQAKLRGYVEKQYTDDSHQLVDGGTFFVVGYLLAALPYCMPRLTGALVAGETVASSKDKAATKAWRAYCYHLRKNEIPAQRNAKEFLVIYIGVAISGNLLLLLLYYLSGLWPIRDSI